MIFVQVAEYVKKYIGCSFERILKVAVEESIVNSPVSRQSVK
jgi:hypothetical protein